VKDELTRRTFTGLADPALRQWVQALPKDTPVSVRCLAKHVFAIDVGQVRVDFGPRTKMWDQKTWASVALDIKALLR